MKNRIYAAPAVKGLNKYEYFDPWVAELSETQLQVGENSTRVGGCALSATPAVTYFCINHGDFFLKFEIIINDLYCGQ